MQILFFKYYIILIFTDIMQQIYISDVLWNILLFLDIAYIIIFMKIRQFDGL